MSGIVRTKAVAVRNHLLDNRNTYVALAAGVGAGMLLATKPGIVIKIKGDNNVVLAELVRRGHPGFIVRCKATGEIFASKRRAAEVLGCSWAKLDDLVEVLQEAS